jgi:DNA polymerase-3 subunit epsilon
MNVILWDTETNGLEKHNSVLSISAIKCAYTINGESIGSKIIDRYERFYFRKSGEPLGEEAIDVNGLSDEIIKEKRKGANYPENFCNDISSFQSFCADTRHFVGHNIFYDTQYINFWLTNTFCTMRYNTHILKLKGKSGRRKWPSLEETAKYYGVDIDKNQAHGSMYDSYITYQVLNKMLEHEKAREKVVGFLERA